LCGLGRCCCVGTSSPMMSPADTNLQGMTAV
jgi:hypothetical protein